MASLNKVQIIGNLGGDPEVRAIGSGDKVANFNVATKEVFTDRSGQRQEKTEWHRVVVWRKLAEIAEKYLRKGSQIYVEGKLTTRSWDDQNGVKKYTTEIVAQNFQMLGSRQGGPSSGPMESSYENSDSGMAPSMSHASDSIPPLPEDDLPF